MDTVFKPLFSTVFGKRSSVGVERALAAALEHAQVIYAEDGSFRVFDGAGWFAFSRIWKPVRESGDSNG